MSTQISFLLFVTTPCIMLAIPVALIVCRDFPAGENTSILGLEYSLMRMLLCPYKQKNPPNIIPSLLVSKERFSSPERVNT